MFRLALSQLLYHRTIAVAQALAIAIVVAVTVALALVDSGAAEVGYQSVVLATASRVVDIESTSPQSARDFLAFQQAADRETRAVLADRLRLVALYSRASSFSAHSLNGRSLGGDHVGGITEGAGYFPALATHVALASGAWPSTVDNLGPASQPTYEATISQFGASYLGLHSGDVYCVQYALESGNERVWCAKLTGIWRAKDRSDPFWAIGPSSFDIVLPESAYFSIAGFAPELHVVTGRAYQPDPAGTRVSDAPALLAGLSKLRAQFAVDAHTTVLTALDQEIARYLDRAAVNQLPVQVVGVSLLLVATLGLLFLARHHSAAQHGALVLWRVRGWRWRDTVLLLAIEFGLLAVVAAPIAIALGWAGAKAALALSTGVGLSPDVIPYAFRWLVPALALIAIALALAALSGTRRTLLELRRLGPDHPGRPWWRSGNADLILAAAAAPLLFETRLRANIQVRSASAADPFAVVFPTLAAAFLALGALRLLPLAATALRRLEPGVTGLLASARLTRQPAEHAGLAMLLTLTVALGLFSSVYLATGQRNAADRAAYQAGSDIRASYDSRATLANITRDVSSLSGVRMWTPAWRTQADIGNVATQASLLAVDPGDIRSVAWARPDLATPDVSTQLTQLARADQEGVHLEGRPTQASVWTYGSGAGGVMTAGIVDATGQHCDCSFGSLAFAGWRQLQAHIGFRTPPSYPLRLTSLLIANGGQRDATVGLSELTVGSQVVEAFSGDTSWWMRAQDGVASSLNMAEATVPARDGHQAKAVIIPAGTGDVSLLPAPVGRAIPALIDANTAARIGTLTGDISIRTGGTDVAAHIIGVLDLFPTFYPGDYFLIVPSDQLFSQLAFVNYSTLNPNEAWMSMTSGAAPAATAQLRRSQSVASVDDRESLASAALHDPVLVQLKANLAIGFVAALALALVGFAVHLVSAIRQRSADFAILQANGVPRRLADRSVLREQATLVAFSVVVGGALGLILSFMLLPGLQLGSRAQDLTPPTVVTFDSTALVAGGLLLACAITSLAALALRLARVPSLLEEIRKLG